MAKKLIKIMLNEGLNHVYLIHLCGDLLHKTPQ